MGSDSVVWRSVAIPADLQVLPGGWELHGYFQEISGHLQGNIWNSNIFLLHERKDRIKHIYYIE